MLLFLLFESLFAFSLPSLCTLTLFEGPRQGGFHQQDRKKQKQKKREKEERKNGALCTARFSDHGPVSGGRSSTLKLN